MGRRLFVIITAIFILSLIGLGAAFYVAKPEQAAQLRLLAQEKLNSILSAGHDTGEKKDGEPKAAVEAPAPAVETGQAGASDAAQTTAPAAPSKVEPSPEATPEASPASQPAAETEKPPKAPAKKPKAKKKPVDHPVKKPAAE